MLRTVVIALGIIFLAIAIAIAQKAGITQGVPVLAVYGVIFTVGVVIERGRYRPRVSRRGRWEPTGERFVDPTTGRLTEVFFNQETGERDYRVV